MSWLFYVLIAAIVIELTIMYFDIVKNAFNDRCGLSIVMGFILVLICFICMMIRSETVPNANVEHDWYRDMSFVNKNATVPIRFEVIQESMLFSRKINFVLDVNETKYLSRCTAGGYRFINECALSSVESEYNRLTKMSN